MCKMEHDITHVLVYLVCLYDKRKAFVKNNKR